MSERIDCWVQKANFESTTFKKLSYAEAWQKFQSFDWKEMVNAQKALEDLGEENCPAGFGIVRGPGEILHIMPDDVGTYFFALHYQGKARLFGLISSDCLFEVYEVPKITMQKTFQLMFQNQPDLILLELKKYKS